MEHKMAPNMLTAPRLANSNTPLLCTLNRMKKLPRDAMTATRQNVLSDPEMVAA